MLTVFLKLHLSILIAGFTGLFGRLVSLDAFWIVFFRMLFGGACLFLYLVMVGRLKSLGPRGILRGMLLGGLLCTHLLLFYSAIKLSNVSIGVVCVSTIGFFVAILEPMMFHGRFSLIDLGYSLLAILGVLFIFGFDSRYRAGISVGIVCAIVSALYSILNRKVASTYDNYALIAWQLAGGVVFMLLLLPCYYLFSGHLIVAFTPLDACYLFLAGTVCTAGMYLLMLQVLQKLSAFTVMLSYNLEPVYSIILAMLIFDEASELNYSFYIGIGFILFSVGLKSFKALQLKRQHEA